MKILLYHLKRIHHFFKTGLLRGLPAQFKYQFPARKLKIITITGTDGKTTSSTLTYHLLQKAGKKVGLISTVAAYIGDQELDTGLHVTAPSPDKLQKFIRQMVDKGIEYLVLELTSHGVYQYRSWGIKPWIAGLTNVTHEHIDYHQTYELYLEAKAKLLRQAKIVILNLDDQSHPKIRRKLKGDKQEIEAYSLEYQLAQTVKQAVKERFPAQYNQMNARLAIKIAKKVGLSDKQIAHGIKSFKGVPGRMEQVKNKRGFETIVDFAHTPNALYQALSSLRTKMEKRAKKNQGRVIAVFGCAGLRDYQKRPMMADYAVKLADLAIFTAEDPRTENVETIIR
ncbi:MAG: UDP-N-acetylmuramyl-tripeptide synthetase, partial [Candidatus Pacebacteria bacterium]|nr:UDP-N-acetylmuramyl-tripeptide synthetase [Candidatus Paceibacterota bacterium]